ncbi:MAG: glycosyltransferase family 39 protein [Pseudomonadota bacterium]|nr:glycosyltransferase family 39 protein [Pseudomonadota bacterium]
MQGPAGRVLERIDGWPAALRHGLLVLVSLACFLPGLLTLPPSDRDESRFAQATKQMVESGDYIDIRFQDTPRHKKPAGIYWMQAVAVHATGVVDAIWVYRLPSLLAGIAAVSLTALIGGMLFAPGTGFVAGIIMASSVLLNVEARLAKTDAMLLALTLVALACLLHLLRTPSRRHALGFWAAAGLGFLVKGPILFLPVAGIIAVQAWRQRGLRWLGRLEPLRGLPLFLLIALPWLVAIVVISDGSFLSESVGKDMAAKLAGGQESHGAPPGLYLALAPLTFWPFSLLGLLALPWIWRNRRLEPVALLLGWTLLTWVIFEATPTKLAHYVLPAYPALAILAAAAVRDGLPGPRWSRYVAFGLWALNTAALAGAMPVLGQTTGAGFSAWQLAGIVLACTGYAGWHLVHGRRPALFATVILITAGLFSAVVFGRFLPALDPVFIAPRIVAALPASGDCERPALASAGYSEPSLVFLAGTATRLTDGAGAADHLAAGGACAVAAVDERQLPAFLDRSKEIGQSLEKLEEVAGFNYARGKRVRIAIYRVQAP